jgi:hypothetical protein
MHQSKQSNLGAYSDEQLLLEDLNWINRSRIEKEKRIESQNKYDQDHYPSRA